MMSHPSTLESKPVFNRKKWDQQTMKSGDKINLERVCHALFCLNPPMTSYHFRIKQNSLVFMIKPLLSSCLNSILPCAHCAQLAHTSFLSLTGQIHFWFRAEPLCLDCLYTELLWLPLSCCSKTTSSPTMGGVL